MSVHHDAIGALFIAVYARLMTGDLVELKAYRAVVCNEIYLEAASTNSYSAILHYWATVHVCFRIVALWYFHLLFYSGFAPSPYGTGPPTLFSFCVCPISLELFKPILSTGPFHNTAVDKIVLMWHYVISCFVFIFWTLSLTPGYRISHNLRLSQMVDIPTTCLPLHINKL